MGAERKKAIYAVCVKYGMIYILFLERFSKTLGNDVDVIIVEDDPYFFLQMPEYVPLNHRFASDVDRLGSDEEFIDSLAPSYLK